MDKTTQDENTSAAAPVAQDPPHGGSWARLPDGSLQLLQYTQPAPGRRTPAAAAAAAAPDIETIEE